MKKREFSKICRSCARKKEKVIDPAKVRELPEETKREMVWFILSARGPIIKELLDCLTLEETRLIQSCGYMYWYRTEPFIFLCHGEWHIDLRMGW